MTFLHASFRCTQLLAIAGLSFAAGCETISSDLTDFFDQMSPPSAAEAGEWAVNFDKPEEQQRGLTLLGNAPWGGGDIYLELYRDATEGPWDPLVKAAAVRALARHGDVADAIVIASQLDNESTFVRLEVAKGLQRIHNTEAANLLWRRLIVEDDHDIRMEIAIALGQYPNDAVFQALVLSLESTELGVNLAASDSLRNLTGVDHGINPDDWLAWYGASEGPFGKQEIYLYPVYTRPLGFFDRINIFNPTHWEIPALPRGLEFASNTQQFRTSEKTEPQGR